MEWKPSLSLGLVVGVVWVLALLALGIYLVVRIWYLPVSLYSFGLALLAALAALVMALYCYRLYGYLSLRFSLDGERLTIAWQGSRHIVPVALITEARPLGPARIRLWGSGWPGYWVGQGSINGVGKALFFTTLCPKDSVLVSTADSSYVLSPADPSSFLHELHLRRQENKTSTAAVEFLPSPLGALAIWRDRPLLAGAALGLLADLSLYAYMCWRYSGLPERLPLHFNVLGEVNRVGERSEVFWLPLIGSLVLGANLAGALAVHARKEAVAAYILVGMAVLVQVLLWVASVRLV